MKTPNQTTDIEVTPDFVAARHRPPLVGDVDSSPTSIVTPSTRSEVWSKNSLTFVGVLDAQATMEADMESGEA